MRSKLILIGGSLATGKSSLARFLETHSGIKRISMDELKERLFDVGGYRDRAWSKRIGSLAWPVFQGMVELHLEQGEDVIAEATFLWPGDREWVDELARRHGAQLIQIWMTADPRIARERFVARAQSQRHPGHCDSLGQVIKEFDDRFFAQTFKPLSIQGITKIVDTTDFDAVDYEEIQQWLTSL